ncbi:uncharacterized protein RAG0_05194 [Rhynchosporium agropyri]|uniref:Uncharacterized protein n=1 Tax=Rhynchosporium agropyri TaxID=914238 RepID=A0A1E1KC16_9HELO|nr:uncharacterized protein RAG0_05194 [Rhynchosporium agropyri]
MKYEYLRGKEGQGYLNGTEWSRDGHRTIPSLNRPPNWESPGDGSLTVLEARPPRRALLIEYFELKHLVVPSTSVSTLAYQLQRNTYKESIFGRFSKIPLTKEPIETRPLVIPLLHLHSHTKPSKDRHLTVVIHLPLPVSRLTDHIHQEAVTVSETVASDSSSSKVRGRSPPRLREPRKVLSDGRREAIHTCFRISSETRRGSLTCCQAHTPLEVTRLGGEQPSVAVRVTQARQMASTYALARLR